jgi:hypothetical protein
VGVGGLGRDICTVAVLGLVGLVGAREAARYVIR